MDNPHIDVRSEGKNYVTLIQCPPDNIPLYWVQETELIMVSKGGDTLAQQMAFASTGALMGALPGAFAAYAQFSKDGKIEIPNLIALMVAFSGLIVTVACGCIHVRSKSYPEKILSDILARKNTPPSSPISN